RNIGRKIDSAPLKAAATDSLCDCIATGMVLVTALLAYFTSVRLDGWAGLIVSFFILYAGYSSGREAIDPLLGTPPDPEYIDHIRDIVLNFDENVIGIHDLLIHDYGPGRKMISLHAEVPSDIDMLRAHDVIDNLEKKLANELGCTATIHMDPIQTNDPRVAALKKIVSELVLKIDENITVHDFRVVFGDSHTNLVFDMAVPFSCPLDDEAIQKKTANLIVSALGKTYYAVTDIDREA
ncbi:MAG: cation transporter, partial [Lachnospiraceae bacterium]|nr:cation transporter [Lachnospiraceae bacterium]